MCSTTACNYLTLRTLAGMKHKAVEREMILKQYEEGYKTFLRGKKFNSPDNQMMRSAYAMGYEDALNSVRPTDDEIVDSILD